MADTNEAGFKLGQRIRRIRKQKGLSLHDVERLSEGEFGASSLGAYERGERAITVARLQRLAELYGVPVDELLPPTQAPRPILPAPPGGIQLDLARLEDHKEEFPAIARYAAMIQMQRQDFNGRVLTIRQDDVRTLACVLDLTPEELEVTLANRGIGVSVHATAVLPTSHDRTHPPRE